MPKKNTRQIFDIFQDFKKIIEAKPPTRQMYDDLRMMRFKVRPISGDISLFELKNDQLIETLWSLGKLDEMFQKEFRRLSPSQKKIFFRIFNDIYQQFQEQLTKISINPRQKDQLSQILEMEIFKERPLKKN